MLSKLFSKKEKPVKFIVPKYVLFNVDTFNTWFNDKNNNAVYANPGIFLRLDKLSESHIGDYLLKCHNINSLDHDFHEEIKNFYYEIKKDWMDKINK